MLKSRFKCAENAQHAERYGKEEQQKYGTMMKVLTPHPCQQENHGRRISPEIQVK